MTKRTTLARALDSLGLVGAALSLRRMVAPPWLTTLCYHRIGDRASVVAGDRGLVDATCDDFERQLDTLSQAFRFVSLHDVEAFVLRASPLPPNPALVTFDDAYREVGSLAWPRLRARGIPAALFVPTRAVGLRRMFWWDRLARAVELASTERFEVHFGSARLEVERASTRSLDALTSIVKRTARLEVDAFVECVEAAAGAPLDRDAERAIVDRSLLDWTGIRALARDGLAIGSHTVTHRVLGTLAPQELEHELWGSRIELEDRLDVAVRSIAYPVGYSIARSPTIRGAVELAGYALGFTCRSGVANLDDLLDPLDVPRLLVDGSYGVAELATYGAWPALAPRTLVDLAS